MAGIIFFIFKCYLLSILPGFCFGQIEHTINHCCSLGSSTATRDHHCNGISMSTPVKGVPPETQSVCFSAMQLCCVHDLRTIECEDGKEVAKSGRNCPDDNTDRKLCCEACKLGIITASMAEECGSQNVNFGCHWNTAYETCCSMNDFQKTDSRRNLTYVPPTNHDQNICELYPGELCAHICEPNLGSFICRCHDGFTLMEDGKTCQQNIIPDRCTTNNPCQQKCHDTGVSIECSCEPGYRLHANNKSCFDVDECVENLHYCKSGEMCVNEPGEFRCESRTINEPISGPTESTSPETSSPPPTTRPNDTVICPLGYRAEINTHQCVDINECKENIHVCQKETEECVNLNGAYNCIKKKAEHNCNLGYKWNPATGSCTDINECEEIDGDTPCDSNQACENTVGSYKCLCKTGYQLDSLTQACVDINECQVDLHNCLPSQRCDNTIGSYQCVRYTNCGTGYTLNAQTGMCEDDDECILKIDNCRYNGPDFICRNTLGSFRCERKQKDDCDANCRANKTLTQQCPRGYQQNANKQCEDINECEKGLGRCLPNQKCVNINGGYTCRNINVITCEAGLRLNEAKTRCTDIDECTEQTRICDHLCINIWGTYRCSCQPGYRLHEDNRTCIDINECELFKDRRLCMGYCVNQPGSYSCQCPQGYILGNDGASCQDIDECKVANVCTSQDEACLNMRGSYRCNSIACPQGYIKEIQHKNRCKKATNTCREDDTECLQQPLTYSFYFITLVSNYTIPQGGLDLFTMRGPVRSSTTVDFDLNMVSAHTPPGVPPANDGYFIRSPSGYNQVGIKLIQTLKGPQDIQLQLTMTFYYNGIYGGKAVSNIGIFVSPYEF